MGKEVTIVAYKPDTQSTEEYMVVVDPAEYKKWKDGDTSIPLAMVVSSFQVFHSSTGHTGKWGKASKQQLETVFETSKEDDAVKKILEKGISKSSESFASKFGDTNVARGGVETQSRGGPR